MVKHTRSTEIILRRILAVNFREMLQPFPGFLNVVTGGWLIQIVSIGKVIFRFQLGSGKSFARNKNCIVI